MSSQNFALLAVRDNHVAAMRSQASCHAYIKLERETEIAISSKKSVALASIYISSRLVSSRTHYATLYVFLVIATGVALLLRCIWWIYRGLTPRLISDLEEKTQNAPHASRASVAASVRIDISRIADVEKAPFRRAYETDDPHRRVASGKGKRDSRRIPRPRECTKSRIFSLPRMPRINQAPRAPDVLICLIRGGLRNRVLQRPRFYVRTKRQVHPRRGLCQGLRSLSRDRPQ